MKRAVVCLLLALPGLAFAGEQNPEVAAGNQAMAAGDPAAALSHYDAAAKDLPGDPDLAFNRGGALYAQKKYDDAARAFLEATNSKDTSRRAEAFRHYGDAQFRKNDLGAASEAYKQALSLNPGDEVARHNLEVALAAKKQQQQQQQQKQQDQKNQPQSQPSGGPESQPSGGAKSQPSGGERGEKQDQKKEDAQAAEAKKD